MQIAQAFAVSEPPLRGLSQGRVAVPTFTNEEADPEVLGIPTRLPNLPRQVRTELGLEIRTGS